MFTFKLKDDFTTDLCLKHHGFSSVTLCQALEYQNYSSFETGESQCIEIYCNLKRNLT